MKTSSPTKNPVKIPEKHTYVAKRGNNNYVFYISNPGSKNQKLTSIGKLYEDDPP